MASRRLPAHHPDVPHRTTRPASIVTPPRTCQVPLLDSSRALVPAWAWPWRHEPTLDGGWTLPQSPRSHVYVLFTTATTVTAHDEQQQVLFCLCGCRWSREVERFVRSSCFSPVLQYASGVAESPVTVQTDRKERPLEPSGRLCVRKAEAHRTRARSCCVKLYASMKRVTDFVFKYVITGK
jgi:hypothetical protein